jgi:hypothetical protein
MKMWPQMYGLSLLCLLLGRHARDDVTVAIYMLQWLVFSLAAGWFFVKNK